LPIKFYPKLDRTSSSVLNFSNSSRRLQHYLEHIEGGLVNMLLLDLLTLATIACAARISISIPPSPQLPNPATLPASTHAILLGPPGVRYEAPLKRDNTFSFSDVVDASYLLSIYSRDYTFPPVRIDVSKSSSGDSTGQTIEAWQTFRGNEWNNKGQQYGSGQGEVTFEVSAVAQKDFYVQRGGFNLLGFLKSPMILMSLVSVVMIFGLPKLMENSMCSILEGSRCMACLLTLCSGPGNEGRDGGDAAEGAYYWGGWCCECR
jgi:ER membrane protein complex subunit 7